MGSQTWALTKIATSTLDAFFAQTRQVYSTVVRPTITYGSIVWRAASGTKEAKKGSIDKMAVIQRKCLRAATVDYRATPVEVLHAETIIPPMQENLELL